MPQFPLPAPPEHGVWRRFRIPRWPSPSQFPPSPARQHPEALWGVPRVPSPAPYRRRRFSTNCSIVTSSRRTKSALPTSGPSSSAISAPSTRPAPTSPHQPQRRFLPHVTLSPPQNLQGVTVIVTPGQEKPPPIGCLLIIIITIIIICTCSHLSIPSSTGNWELWEGEGDDWGRGVAGPRGLRRRSPRWFINLTANQCSPVSPVQHKHLLTEAFSCT